MSNIQDYITFNSSVAVENGGEDPITLEEMKSSHPREIMTIRLSNNKNKAINTTTLKQILDRGLNNPLTHEPFKNITKQRINLYHKSLEKFPNYKLDVKNLYGRWLESFGKENKNVELEAQCFLQAEDLLTIFEKYNGKGNKTNRVLAEQDIIDGKRDWILRNSSVTDTKLNKAYALTHKINGKICSKLIIHKLGEGFYLEPKGILRGQSAGKKFETFKGVYPTIIHLLEDIVLKHP